MPDLPAPPGAPAAPSAPAIPAAPALVPDQALTPSPPTATPAPVPATPATAPAIPPAAPNASEPAPGAPAAPKPEGSAEPDAPAEPAPEAEPLPETDPALAEAEKPAAPVYDFKLPEGITAKSEQLAPFTGILAEHGIAPEAGQKLLDLHAAELQRTVAEIQQGQVDVFEKTKANWAKEFADSAGNRRDTTLNEAKAFIQKFGGSKAEISELWNVLAFTGAGNHKAVIRLLARASRNLNERPAPHPGVPGGSGANQSPADRRYGAKR